MLMQIFTHTPLWVWALAAALLALGLWQRRTRSVAPGALLGLPLGMLALGLWTLVPAFVQLPVTTLIWLLALGGGLALGRQLPVPRGAAWQPATRRLHLPGSWVPLLLIGTIFSLRYAAAVALALNPALRLSLVFQALLALIFGLLGGLFLGRSLSLLGLRPDRAATCVAASAC
jgi:hypothetical protein